MKVIAQKLVLGLSSAGLIATILGGTFSPTMAQVRTIEGVEIKFINETSSTTVYAIYTRGNYRNATWGSDKLGSSSLAPGEQVSFNFPKGVYDFCVSTFRVPSLEVRSLLWNNKNTQGPWDFHITDDAWTSNAWFKGSCSSR